jgi:L-ascorbate metabolism protein UlaG (beta-lactamase superfamily)
MPEPAGGPLFPKHFDGRRFYNPEGPQPRGFRDVLRWKLNSRGEPSPQFVADVRQSVPPRLAENGELLATLVNHSTVLLQRDGVNILTDPIFSERTSPLSWIGPRRRRAPGVRIEDLPEIQLVPISHNHYDHLDLPTLRRLASRGKSTFIAPLGVGELLRSEKIGPVCELDWGETQTFGSTTISCVPALHFSARGLFDRNKTLWCGYVIGGEGGNVYFAGDTAFGGHFEQIRERFGPPRLALLPIGAYEPRWFMSPIHMEPAESVKAHGILGASTSIAIHHGTFQLADDSIDTPRREMLKLSPPASFLMLENGQSARIA